MKVYKDTTFWMLLGLYSSTVFMQRLMLHCLYFPTRSSQTQTLHTNITKINFTPRKFVKNYVYVRHWLLKQLFNGWGTVAVALLPLHVFCHLRYFRCGSGFGRIRMILSLLCPSFKQFNFFKMVLHSEAYRPSHWMMRDRNTEPRERVHPPRLSGVPDTESPWFSKITTVLSIWPGEEDSNLWRAALPLRYPWA